MGSFSEKVSALALEALGRFELAEAKLGMVGWSKEQARFLNFCLDNEVMSIKELEEAVAVRIRKLGRESYLGHINSGTWPDHTMSPQALAFAIRTGELTDGETDKITFDQGDTRYNFFKGIEDTLVATVIAQLRAA